MGGGLAYAPTPPPPVLGHPRDTVSRSKGGIPQRIGAKPLLLTLRESSRGMD